MSTSPNVNSDALKLLADLEGRGVHYIRLTWVDLINFVRYRVIPIKHFKKLLGSQRGMMIAKVSLGLVYIQMAPGFGSSGEYLYVPDMRSARLLGFADGHASVMGWFQEKESTNGMEMQSVSICPRNLLRRTAESAKRLHGIDFLMGFETEVIFLKSTSPVEAVNNYGWSESPAISAGTAEAKTLEEIADALEKSGIELQMYHAEAAPGQFEIVTGPLPPLEAVDALVATREIIFNFASKHGMRATLAPRVYKDSCGSAAHVHMSLRSTKPSPTARILSAPTLTELEASFLQGLLDHLPAVTAFSLPTPASYGRMVDGVWSGGTWVAWGKDNRECPVRLCGLPGNHNFEVKSLDGTANPYLAIAAMLTAGMLGVRKGAKLVVQDCQELAASLSESERIALGVTKRMPLKVEEARQYLKEDSELVKELGEELVSKFLAVNETLAKALEASTVEATLTRLVETF